MGDKLLSDLGFLTSKDGDQVNHGGGKHSGLQ